MHTLAAPLLALAAGDTSWTARYVVTFVDGPEGAHRAEVVATLESARGASPSSVELSMSGGYGGGYGAFVRGLEPFVPEGSPEPRGALEAEVLDAEDGEFRIPVLRDGRVGFRYTVVLEHDPDEELGWDETPHAFSDGTLWTGRALFVAPDGAEVEVEFVTPEGQRVSTSLDPGDEEGHYRAATTGRLRPTYLLVGGHYERELEVGGTTVVLAIDGAAVEARALFERSVRRIFESATEALGGPPAPRCLVAITRADAEGGGSTYGNDAHVLVKGPPVEGGDDGWLATLCHESLHLWNPPRVGFDSREMWYSEGFTDYYAHLLLARTGARSGRAFLGSVRDWASSYRAQDPVGLRAAGVLGRKNNVVIYNGGALAAFCLDVAIRDASAGRRSLDDVLQALYALVEKNGGPVAIGELQELLEKRGGKTGRSFLARHVEGDEPLPLEEAFELAGLTFEERTIAVPARKEAIVDLFQCSGMTVVAGGLEVNRSEGGRLEPGDLVVEVAGRAVRDFGDLQRALADRAPGDQVAVVALRKGKREELEVRLGGHGVDIPTSASVEVVLEPLPKTGKRARAIREALFGEL